MDGVPPRRRRPVRVEPVATSQTAPFDTAPLEPAPAGLRRLEAEDRFRRDEARKLLKFFYSTNIAVFGFVLVAWVVQTWFVAGSAVGSPLITERVVLALIGGSVVQLGTLAVAVGRGLFRSA